ncbi:MAG: peptidase [Thermoleophilia bacterium]|nr:peptidase [Thermoleophilia bacterium]
MQMPAAAHMSARCWSRFALGFAVATLSLIAALGATASAHAAGRLAPTDRLAHRSDAQLAAQISQLEADAAETGEHMLGADAQRVQIDTERSATQDALGAWLADRYRSGEFDGALLAVIGGGGVHALADRMQVAQVIAGYHRRLIDELDQADARMEATAIDRATLVQRLAADQAALRELRVEQQRRADLVARQHARAAAVREAHTQAARAKAAAKAAPSGALVGFTTPLAVASSFNAMQPPNAGMIDAYLASKGSPMAGQGAAFVASGARYQVDPRFVVAIAGAESSFGSVTCGPFNAWGWACPNDPADFADWATGIETITRGLRIGYLDEGRTSVASVQQKYAPSAAANDPTGLNLNWVTNVSRFLVELGGNPDLVGPGPLRGPALPDLGTVLFGNR